MAQRSFEHGPGGKVGQQLGSGQQRVRTVKAAMGSRLHAAVVRVASGIRRRDLAAWRRALSEGQGSKARAGPSFSYGGARRPNAEKRRPHQVFRAKPQLYSAPRGGVGSGRRRMCRGRPARPRRGAFWRNVSANSSLFCLPRPISGLLPPCCLSVPQTRKTPCVRGLGWGRITVGLASVRRNRGLPSVGQRGAF